MISFFKVETLRKKLIGLLLRFRQERIALKPVFHFARIVPKRTGEHAQIEKRFINPRTSGCIRVSK
jgi:hypothetical protein